ncbi:unnamed protein product [Durusdinium trenchii]|uniref:Saccharopine dehydrogenase (NAD(+), L-glutamate-forming) n=1 Tax=Durusdinium trenchii TaxID=1381693 RepID=A0ABP0NU14_9DINO
MGRPRCCIWRSRFGGLATVARVGPRVLLARGNGSSRTWCSSVRAHMPMPKGPAASGKPGVLGLRREDKNKWERRAPLAPRHVAELQKEGLKIIVQPCTRRVFTDAEYEEAGAEVREDLSECSTILAVKEVPVELLLPGRTWCFFSHTIKAQPSGMPLLDAALEKKVRLVDYECITKSGTRFDTRLVAFGAFAGYAGAIDFLRGLGERLLALGFSTPLLHIGSAFMYPTLEEAKRAVALAGDAIRKNGLPKAMCPFTAVFTGTGNVSQGALEIFKLLPHEMVDPSDLPKLCQRADKGELSREDCHKLHLSIATAEHMVRRRDGLPFDKNSYYSQPDDYEPTFQDSILPYATVVLNGMYWDARFPRLFTSQDLHRHVVNGRDKLLGVCDITCDADGSVPTRQFASIEQPFHILNALTERISPCLDDPGILFHAVDHLPSELPRESSEHFGDCLVPFLPSLASQLAPMAPLAGDEMAGSANLPMPIRGAIITEGGQLARDYRYIQQLRDVREGKVVDVEENISPTLMPPACCTLEFTGHLFDSRLINRVADMCEESVARMQILVLDLGRTVNDESFCSMMVMASSEKSLETLVVKLETAAAESHVTYRRATQGALRVQDAADPAVSADLTKKVLVLGSGHVASPLIAYLARKPTELVVASVEQKELNALRRLPGLGRVKTEVLDIAAADHDSAIAEKLETFVKESDLVISLLPAHMHVGVAKMAIQHGVSMVTASYVSPEMAALHEAAEKAGVLILNEVGLDPGIDHLSAMSMIDTARSTGSEILRFASLCGGLPSPEAAGSNPIGYKFSWSPRGVLVASQNSARFKEDGLLREIAGEDLLAQGKPITINNAFALDVLPNRDSTMFAELYGLADIPTFIRGTLRFRGFCERMLTLSRLGLLQVGPIPGLADPGSQRVWLEQVMFGGNEASRLDESLSSLIRKRLTQSGSDPEVGLEFLSWLGLLQDVIAHLLQRPETTYAPGERDLVVMRHELDLRRNDGAMERQISTLIQYGEPHETAMAKTVGVTAAICAQLILDTTPGHFGFGVQRPLRHEWYQPVLKKLEAEGIYLREHVEQLEAPK